MHAKHLQQSLAHSGNISHRRFTWHLHRPTTQYEVSVVLLVGMVRLKSDVIIMIIIIINTFGNLGEAPKEWPRSVTDGPPSGPDASHVGWGGVVRCEPPSVS